MSIEDRVGSIQKVDRVDVVHKGDGCDGYPTFVLVNGDGFGHRPPKHEVSIMLICEADSPVRVLVECRDGSVDEYQPKEFDLRLLDLRVTTDPCRNPCRITIGGIEPAVRSLRILFAEGQAVWVDMTFLPKLPMDEPTIVEGEPL